MPTCSTSRRLTASLLALSLASDWSTAQSPPPAHAVAAMSPALAAATALVDTDADGTIWARGADWKASFDASGAQFVPFLGSHAPRNFPLALHALGASADGAPLPFDTAAAPLLTGCRVTFARGACTEVYDLAREHVEQSFVFASAPPAGPVQLRMRWQSELPPSPHEGGGFVFANEYGGVRYGEATAVDAQGRRTAVTSERMGDQIVLTVPAAFVAAAAWPLVVDPLLTTFAIAPGSFAPSQLIGDVAHVGSFTGLTAVVHEEIFSATDHDIFVTGYESNGAIGAAVYVDYTSSNWYSPSIASHRGQSQFLVVASRSALLQPSIWARTLTYVGAPSTSLTPSAPFLVHATLGGRNAHVGGDPNPNPPAPGNYCVVWEGVGNGEIYYNIVHTDTSLGSPTGILLDSGPEVVSNPAIGKSCGVGAYNTREWVVVWQKRYSPTDEDIHGSRIAGNGTLLTLDFPIDTSSQSETHPAVSSLTDLIEGVERYVVVYERTIPPIGPLPAHQQILGQVFTGTTSLSGEVNLSQLLSTDPLGDQLTPSVDTDGTRFVVGFNEDPAILSQDIVPYLATVHVINDTFNYTELPVALDAFAGRDEFVRITAERSGGTFISRYAATWQQAALSTPATAVRGAWYMGHLALGPTSYFAEQFPSCGSSTLTASGLPALGNTFQLDLSGATAIPVILFGAGIAPTPVCPSCQLGVDPSTMLLLPGSHLTVTVPQVAALIGTQVGTQGLDLLAQNGCASPLDFTLSNMILITVL